MGNCWIRCRWPCLPLPRAMSCPAPVLYTMRSRMSWSIMEDHTGRLRRAAINHCDLNFGERLDQGSYGTSQVFKGELHGMPIFIKKVRFLDVDVRHWAKEIVLLSTLWHPNIVLFVGLSFDIDDNFYLVTEYEERGDLGSILLDQSIALSWTDLLLQFVVDICRGMAYLHSHEPKYIHGNLKAANILISANGQVAKLADCGLARLSKLCHRRRLYAPFWVAPEILRGDECTSMTDVYSFGIVLAEIETRKQPYHDRIVNHSARLDWPVPDIVDNTQRPKLSENAPSSIASIYERCVLNDPNGRPSFDQLLVEFESLRETLVAEVQDLDIGKDALVTGTRTNDDFRVGEEDAHEAASTTLPDDVRQNDFQPAGVRSVAKVSMRSPALDRLYHALQRLELHTANAPIAAAQELDLAKDALSARLDGDFCVERKMPASY
ncbi:TKL/DRK protein kinase [Saprolegnia diclina VS20]|uniref:TKL/DRK protein kinase n=1 Tax=Saprolegnia diclina (strain VS20) TaxID=1156394 RepID=T0PTT9_SAPDV|nr:TKL/DRK protein kinase [Saprolegnia diclina VS20]EQC25651.1 TKL/DRK protein kinase [Saprolegnia diclina VS20]|eukprot:XP_008620942.1 TKL/DRK protein kinase [Saprolegnia diclina VS20]